MKPVLRLITTVLLLLSVEVSWAASACVEDVTQYMARVRSLFEADKFDMLDALAVEARKGGTVFAGGYHEIAAFYDGLSYRDSGGSAYHDLVWQAQVKKLQVWAKRKPKSITPRIALALTHRAWGWQKRGNTYAESVEPEAWQQYREQVRLAHQSLEEAAKLNERCPVWYLALLDQALDEGWDKQRVKELLAKAEAYAPWFQQFYKRHANYLLPQWYGEKDEVETWAEEVRTSIGGEYGDYLYFEIATSLGWEHRRRMSWPEIKAGYAVLKKLYGSNVWKRNLFAKMAVDRGDKEAAREAFAEINDCWDEGVWGSWDNFRKTRASLF